MKLRFIGSGDAFGSGGRFNTCFHVEHPNGAFLIDCGATSLVALRRAGVEPNDIDAIFITHLHGDHFGGLPFLLQDAEHVSRRTRDLDIIGPPGIAARYAALGEAMYPGISGKTRRFAFRFHEVAPGGAIAVAGVEGAPFQMRHDSGAPSMGWRLSAARRTLAYTGDTGWTEEIIPLGRGADLLLCECSFFDLETDSHLAWTTIQPNLPRIGARRVALTHMGPGMIARRHEIDEPVILAEDGKVIEL